MANKATGYGLTAELKRKNEAKFDVEYANEAMDWIKEVLAKNGEDHKDLIASIKPVAKMEDVQTNLKDGVALCEVIKILKPGQKNVQKINKTKMAFKQMENIQNFLHGAEDIGLLKADLFQTVDLYEASNINSVINGIHSLGRKVHDLPGNMPTLGPKESSENKREFTDEQLNSGKGVIGLQMGSNKGASQAGQNFGKTRAIID